MIDAVNGLVDALMNGLFAQYATYAPLSIVLEMIAAVFGVASVLLARKTNIWVYPVGLVSTALYVYLLWQWQLFGDMLINVYYSIMSVYGWYNWSKSRTESRSAMADSTGTNSAQSAQTAQNIVIERITASDLPIMFGLSAVTVAIVAGVYYLRPVINNGFSFAGATLGVHLFTWVDYTDMLTTALFLMGMVLMARRKIENWLVWIVADAISVPLYFYKGFTFTAVQYVLFTLIAVFGYLEWRRRYRLQMAQGVGHGV